MRKFKRLKFFDCLYILIIFILILCGNYKKIIGNYEENTGIYNWVQVENQERIEQSINLIQYPYEMVEKKISVFIKGENINVDNWLEIYFQESSLQNEIQYEYRVKNGIQKIDIELPDDLETGEYKLSLIPHINSQAKIEVGISYEKFNLKNLVINGTELDGHLSIESSYDVYEIKKKSIVFRNTAIAVMVILLFTAVVCVFRYKTRYGVFVCSFIITFLYIILSYFELVLDFTPFIEDALLFGESAKYENFWIQCFIKDEGYLCIIQHLVAWFCERVIRMGYRSYLGMNIFAVLFISLMNSIINLPVFETMAGRKTRFFVSICIPVLFVRQYESYAFINFIYWGIILIMLTLFINLDDLRRELYIGLMIIEALICLSKGIYAIMFPITLLYLIMLAVTNKCSKRNVCFWLCIGIAGLVQVLSYIMTGSGAVDSSGFSLQEVLLIFMQIGRLALGITPFLTPFSSEIILSFLGILVCVCGLIEFIKAFLTKNMKHILLTVFIALGICNSIMVEINAYYNKKEIGLWYSRQEFFTIVAYIFVAMLVVSGIRKYKFVVNYGILFFGSLFCIRIFMDSNTNLINSPNIGKFSVARMNTMNWNLYGPYYNDKNYFIKIMPTYFSLSRNVFVDYYSSGIGNYFLGVNNEKYEKSFIPCNNIPNQNISNIKVADNSRLWGVYFMKNGVSYQYEVMAYDNLGKLICRASQPDNCNANSCIVKFSEPVEDAAYITFHDVISDRDINILSEYAVVYMDN